MIEVMGSREITEDDKETVKKTEKAAREYMAEKELQGNDYVEELDEERYEDYGEMMDDAKYVYRCGGMAVEHLDEPKETVPKTINISIHRTDKHKKISYKTMFVCKDMAIGILFSILMIIGNVLPTAAVHTTVILLVTLAFTVTAVLYIGDCLADKWMKGR